MPAKKKRTVKKKKTSTKKKTVSKKTNDPNIKKLIEVNILTQETNLTLIKSINELSKRINNLVNMFEEAARNVGDIKAVTRDEIEDITRQMQQLLQQNKDLAEGLLNLNSYVRRK